MPDAKKPDEVAPVLRKTGNVRRPDVQETTDPEGKRPVAQWVVSGAVVRPAHEVLPDPAHVSGLPARASTRPGWWMLAVAAATGFAVAIPVTWVLFSMFAAR